MHQSSYARCPGNSSRRRFLRDYTTFAAFGLGALTPLAGCTPRLNWRMVRHPDALWQASFPGKPTTFTRQLVLHSLSTTNLSITPRLEASPAPDTPKHPGLTLPFALTLWAVVIDEQRFTLGLAQPVASLDVETLGLLARGLEQAMVRNIFGTETGTVSQAAAYRQTSAIGTVRLAASGDGLPARLVMRTWVTSMYVVEALVVGPESGFEPEAAEQFLSSVQVAGALLPQG